MKTFRKAFLIVAATSLAAALASADSITASLYSPLAPSGTTPSVVSLTGITTPSQSMITGSDYTVSFATASNQGVVQGNVSGAHAVPVAGVMGTTPEYLTGNYGSSLTTDPASSGNYFSTGVGSITFTFSTPQTSLAVLWGSIDTGNSLSFNTSTSYMVTGTAVQMAAGSLGGNGFQGAGGSAYVVINTSTPFTTVVASSTVPSFEFAGLAAATTPFTTTPEPASLLLFGLGIAAIGLIVRRRQTATQRS